MSLWQESGDINDSLTYPYPSIPESLNGEPSSHISSPEHTTIEITGPWFDLNAWYKEHWDEIEHDLARGVSEDRIPDKALRDELVQLYFQHVHPICPIIDEVEFHSKCYLRNGDSSFLQCVSLLEFQAMMFAASLVTHQDLRFHLVDVKLGQHLNTTQIQQTRYRSTSHCHANLFETAKSTYNACLDGPPIALTRTALLLSYWSPYSSETQSNCYWVDQALKMAVRAHLHDPGHVTTDIAPGRKKLIWWCCLLRDRLLAFGLHRTLCLSSELTCQPPSFEDFGLEASFPRFTDLPSKWQAIQNFIQQSELSEMIAQMLKYQFTPRPDRIKEITDMHQQLVEWRTRFEISLSNSLMSPGACDSTPVQLTRIFCESAVLALYLPYLSFNSQKFNKVIRYFSWISLQHVKDAVSRIARCVNILAYNSDTNAIPLAIGAWITLPIAVKLVFIYNSGCLEDPARELREMRSLMNVLFVMKNRFSGGKFVSDVLDAVISHIILAGAKNNWQDITNLLQDSAGIVEQGLASGVILTPPL